MKPSNIDSETLRRLTRWAKRRGFRNHKKVAEAIAGRLCRQTPLPFIRPALAKAKEEEADGD